MANATYSQCTEGALPLRAMNMLYEGLKQNATFVIVPSTVLETMQLGAQPGLRPMARIMLPASATGKWRTRLSKALRCTTATHDACADPTCLHQSRQMKQALDPR
jgi:hypothetical protein